VIALAGGAGRAGDARRADFQEARRRLDAFLATRPSGRERYRASIVSGLKQSR
jgi:hypothetical protein